MRWNAHHVFYDNYKITIWFMRTYQKGFNGVVQFWPDKKRNKASCSNIYWYKCKTGFDESVVTIFQKSRHQENCRLHHVASVRTWTSQGSKVRTSVWQLKLGWNFCYATGQGSQTHWQNVKENGWKTNIFSMMPRSSKSSDLNWFKCCNGALKELWINECLQIFKTVKIFSNL